ETQSMICDSILSDAYWRARYAKTRSGEPMPFAIIEKLIRTEKQVELMFIRGTLTICYFEKELYELTEQDLTPKNVLAIAKDVEERMQFMERSPRPSLAVPHVLAGESSAYYHGYMLAEMAVHQTREYFLEKFGY